MIFNYNGAYIFYDIKNKDASLPPIIFLHGWGRSGDDFDMQASFFKDRTILTIDFPPFGRSQQDIKGWNIFTYAGLLMSLCDHLNIETADFIGHSFGGRILIIVAAVKRSLVHSCILVDSAGMKPRRSLKYKFNLALYKFKRKLGLKSLRQGSPDYAKLSPEMKETFKSIVGTYLEPYAQKIANKTLIVWGRLDNETPLYMAKRLNKLIKNSKLVVLENGGHFSFIDCPLEFYNIVNEFLK